MIAYVASEAETFSLGKSLATALRGGDIVLLGGFLGAGKTVLCKGIAAGLGILSEVLSPTFALMCQYEAPNGLTLCHIDAYRLKSVEEAEEAGILEVLGDEQTIAVVEWHENIAPAFMHKVALHVAITDCGNDCRKIELDGEWFF